jgi:hypothetical protein
MYELVTLQVRLPAECLITHIAGIWALSSMYELVSLHIKLLTKCLITHITGIRTLASMCKQMFL